MVFMFNAVSQWIAYQTNKLMLSLQVMFESMLHFAHLFDTEAGTKFLIKCRQVKNLLKRYQCMV